MRSLFRYLSERPPWFLVILGLLLILCLGVLDILTGPELSFAVFYLIPVFLLAWFTGRWYAAVLSVVCAAVWLTVDLLAWENYSHLSIALWNSLTRLILFLVSSFLMAALKQRLEREEELARTDALTGVANVRRFIELAGAELSRAQRYQRPFTMIYLDADNFKRVNDEFGHNIGDALLRRLARTMRSEVRATDVVARLGGDEFAILLPETDYEAARSVIRKVRDRLLSIVQQQQYPVTFSIGAVTFDRPPDSIGEMVRQADDLMYVVKRGGKNAVRHERYGDILAGTVEAE